MPDAHYKFPSTSSRNLKFQYSWFQNRPWLRYSAKEDGAYCLWCSLFAAHTNVGKGGHEKPGQLVNSKFSGWKNAKEVFLKHEKDTEYHNDARVSAASFQAVQEGKQKSIIAEIDSALQREVNLL